MHRKNLIIILTIVCILAILISPSLQALSLSGKSLGIITYVPGSRIVNHYRISNTNLPVEVELSPGPFSSITVSEIVNDEFDLIIDFPAGEHIPTGGYSVALTVKEASDPGGTAISSVVAVSKVFQINVLSYKKEIRASLSAPNVNVGSNATVHLSVSSVGYPDINEVYGDLSIYDQENMLLETVTTEHKPLPGLGSVGFVHTFPTEYLPPAEYTARAVVWYDGQQQHVNASFLIGTMDLQLKDYTAVLQQGFSEFSARVMNNWGNRLRGVYAQLFLNESMLLHTPTIELSPWEEGVLKGLVKVDVAPGRHNGTLTLFFEGESKDVPVEITVLKAPAQQVEKVVQAPGVLAYLPAIAAGMVSLVLLVMLAIYLFRARWVKKQRKEEW